jgi:DNA polymerase I-like protein with 3'-5' exonuclease and polymerase domains
MTRKTADFRPDAVRHVLQRYELTALLQVIEKHQGAVVLDLETTSLNEHWAFARVVTASVTLPQLDIEGDEIGYPLTYVIGLSHPDAPMHTNWRECLRLLAKAIYTSGLPVIGQNIRFDVRWITAMTGVNLASRIYADTGMSSHLHDENRSAALKSRAMSEFGIAKWIDFDWKVIESQQVKDPRYPFCPLLAERVDYFTMAMYNARDTYWTWRLHQRHEEELGLISSWREELEMMGDRDSTNALRLGAYYHTVSMPAVRTLTNLEQHGWMLDRQWCQDRLKELEVISQEALMALEAALEQATGFVETWMPEKVQEETWETLRGPQSFEPTALWFKAWAEVLCAADMLRVLAITPKGQASWGKATLKRLAREPKYHAAASLLTYRKATKEAQYIRSWLELAEGDGRIHSTYNYYRVVTGRLSSSNPNCQQIPKPAKDAFCAAPGFVLVTADYSQIELRVAAHVADCVPMREAFIRGDDLHTLMAAIMAGIDPSEVNPDQRQGAKAGNFGFLFGMGAHKFVTYADDTYGVLFTHEEAEEIRETFFSTWVGMQEWHDKQRADAYRDGYVKSPLGRLRRLPEVWGGDNYKIEEAGRKAINSPVQGMASDMMTLATGKIARQFPHIKPVGIVHDAVICEVPEDTARESALAIKATMEGIHVDLKRLGCEFSVPLVADVAIGRNWGSAVPLK